MKVSILLTACVNPDGMALTALQDKDERLVQYEQALNWYLDHTDYPIVFVENSGCDISSHYLSRIEEGHLEMLTFLGNDYPHDFGKGYGEAEILDYALKHSAFLKDTDVIVKITGRLICRNVNTLIGMCKRTDTVMAQVIKDRWGRMQCKSQVVVFPQEFLRDFFLPFSSYLNDTKRYWFEHLLWDASRAWQQEGFRFKEFIYLPRIEGQSGSMGTRYTNSLWDTMVYPLKVFVHKLFHYYGTLNPLYLLKRNK